MSSLRRSSGLTNLVADTLRLRGTTAPGLVITDAIGEVSVSTAPDLTGLTVTGSVQLGDTNVIGSLTANSLTALTSVRAPTAILHSIDASSAVVDTLRSRSIVFQGTLGTGTLTFSDTEGLLLNSMPVISSGSGAQGATGPLGPTGPAGEFTPTPVPFDPLSDASSLQDVIQTFNLFLQSVEGLLVTVQIPEITNFVKSNVTHSSATLSWDLSGNDYLFTIAGAGLHTDISGRTFTLTGLAAETEYTVTITGQNNRVFAPESKQLTFTTTAAAFIPGFIQQTEYVLDQSPVAQVPLNEYFNTAYYGSPSGPTYLRDIQANANNITYYLFSDGEQNNRIYRSVFYLKPPTDISGMLLWVFNDDGCAIRYMDPDNPNVWINLINNQIGWAGGAAPGGGAAYRFPGDNVGTSMAGNGILLNMSSQKYYKFECISTNTVGLMLLTFGYTVPTEQTPGTSVTYTVQNGVEMGIMMNATPSTAIPPGFYGSQDPEFERTIIPIDYTWYYCDPL